MLIAPHQPFKDISKMEWRIGESIKVSLDFEGEIFETEDQRNWADSSYKTYSTPLNLPSPVDVKKGEKVEQKIELTITGSNPRIENDTVKEETKVAFPKIGYSCTASDELNDEEIELLQKIPFDHYRVELPLFDAGWKQLLRKRAEEASRLSAKLELILFFDEDFTNQLQRFVNESSEILSSVVSILPLNKGHPVTPVSLLNLVYQEIKGSYTQLEIGYGTDGFFADLNRNRPGEQDFDFLSFPLSPQVHASDTRSLLENLERQKDMYETARSYAPRKKINVSPITFKIRSAPNHATAAAPDYDARQHRNFGAVWTLYTINNLARADRLTFYEVKGYRGILNDQACPEQSSVYTMLQKIKMFNPKWIIEEGEQGVLNGRIVIENQQGERLQFDVISGDEFRSYQLAVMLNFGEISPCG